MPLVATQSVPDAVQFDGTTAKGLFSFSKAYEHLPRTTGILISLVAYTELNQGGGQNIDVAVVFYFFREGETDLSKRILIALDEAKGGDLQNPITGNAEGSRIINTQLPREAGDKAQFWSIVCLTVDKEEDATASVTFALVPVPETAELEALPP